MKLIQHSTKESQLHSNILWNYNDQSLGPWPTIHFMQTPYELVSIV